MPNGETKHNDLNVFVYARYPDQLKSNKAEMDRLLGCGTILTSLAKEVLEKGSATIPISKLRPAMDTEDGVEAISDQFVLLHEKTREPLIHFLIKEFIKIPRS